MNNDLHTIAVDLTPVLPGGENGGAKIFVLELLRGLAEMVPSTQFILLTQAASHDELASMDRGNMRRLMIVGAAGHKSAFRIRVQNLASRALPLLPGRVSRLVGRAGSMWNARLKRSSAGLSLRAMGVDLLFCPFTAPTYFESGIPTVCTIYDLQYKTYPEFFAPEDVAHRDHTFVQACRRATVLAAISDYSRQSAITHGNLDGERIRTIHLRMAKRMAPELANESLVLERYGLAHGRYLVYPANFWKHKNHEMLLTAFGMACHRGLPSDIKLICTGAPGERQAWLKRASEAMNLGGRIVFPGYLPNAELAALMSTCIGVVFPSLYEGFGLPVIEAMAAGVPVACSNSTSLPEVAAGAALLFDPRVPDEIAGAMIALVGDAGLRKRCVDAGLQRAAEFSDSARMVREYWEAFLYAFANRRDETLMTGVYPDGWVGPNLNLHVGSAKTSQTLEIELAAPEWLPQSTVTVQAMRGGRKQGKPVVVNRGGNAVLSLDLEASGGGVEVYIEPFFIPAESGHGDDRRRLSVILQRCGIVLADGGYVQVFPEEVAT
jgi:glycosyltransferase involved in cell wall biosynthesis